MWGSIASAIIGLIGKGLALFGVYLGGEQAQRSKDQAKVIDAATVRAQVEDADSQLSDAAVLAKLRAGK